MSPCRVSPRGVSWVPPLLLLLALPACSLRRQPPPSADGATIYRLQNCANCHGERGEGTHGPPLANLGAHWTRETLAEFVADPAPVAERDPRLKELNDRYGGGKMGRYDNLDLALRLTLADWLLDGGVER